MQFSEDTFEEDNGSEGHDNHADEEVCYCQGHQEIVCHVLQLPGENTIFRQNISDISDASDICNISAISDIIEINYISGISGILMAVLI